MSEFSCDGGGLEDSICPVCGTRTISVSPTTLFHLLKPSPAREVNPEKTYGVCRERSCDLVYFSANHDQTWTTTDVQITVGFKQPPHEPPHPVCYCFGYTEENIAREIEDTGKSTVVEWITERVQTDDCACEYKNPTGRCCLGNVKETVKKTS